MKQLSGKELRRRVLIGAAVYDYFGVRIDEAVFTRIRNALINRSINRLGNDMEKYHAKQIQDNVRDSDYLTALSASITPPNES